MSKSLGNFFTIREILERFDAETIRFFIIRAHYRSPLNYSDAHLDDARNALRRLYTALQYVSPNSASVSPSSVSSAIDWNHVQAARFKAAMDEDFGTPEAVAVLFELASEVNKTQSVELSALLKALGGCLGLLQEDPSQFLKARSVLDEAAIQTLIDRRAAAKLSKDFATADQIRNDLLAQGVVLKDAPSGTSWTTA